jgi:hypothetical protein
VIIMYTCPVCGFDRMLRPPHAGYICPCCGVEFEVDDDEFNHAELRGQWIARGMPWFSRAADPPVGWNPIDQLSRVGTVLSVQATTTDSRDIRGEQRLERLVPSYILPNESPSISVSGAT